MTKEEEDGNKKIWLSLPLENQSVQKFQSLIGPKPIQRLIVSELIENVGIEEIEENLNTLFGYEK